MKNSYKVPIGILIIVLIAIAARYTVFKDQVDEWGAGVTRISEWEKEYRNNNPNASDEEVDAAFKAGTANITVWMEKYKREHPGSTDADAQAAFDTAWKK